MRANVFIRKYTTKKGETRYTLIVRENGRADRSIFLGPISKKIARERRLQVLNELLNGDYLPEPIVHLYFGEFVDKVFNEYAVGVLAPKTTRRYYSHLKGVMNRFHGFRLNQIRRENLEAYFADYKVSGKTKNILRAALRLVFKKAVEWRYLKKSPVEGIKKFPEDDKVASRALTPNELSTLLNGDLNPYQKLIIQVLVNTGMRPGELSNLKLQDIDWEANRVSIVTDKTRRTKNRKTRHIPMNRELRKALVFLRDRLPIVGGKEGIRFVPRETHQEYVFCHPDGSPIRSFKTTLKKALKRYDIQRVTPHGFRKTFCSMLARSKVHPKVAQQLMGHSDINLTMKIYTEIDDDQLREAVNALPSNYGPPRPNLRLVGGQS